MAIASPAGFVNAEYVHDAAAVLAGQGWQPVVMPHALGRSGRHSAGVDERYADIAEALTNPDYRAVLCSRGGYGMVHHLERLSQLPIEEDPKWVIGFSDISALHALLSSKGVASIHSPMARQIAKGAGDDDVSRLFAILRGQYPVYSFPPHPCNREGTARGTLYGGNLSVLSALVSTRCDLLRPDSILFIEDIAEPPYKVERMLYTLRLNGVLATARGLLVGQFTDVPGGTADDIETLIHNLLSDYSFPMAFGVPVGHGDHNIPLIEGATVTLQVSSGAATLDFEHTSKRT